MTLFALRLGRRARGLPPADQRPGRRRPRRARHPLGARPRRARRRRRPRRQGDGRARQRRRPQARACASSTNSPARWAAPRSPRPPARPPRAAAPAQDALSRARQPRLQARRSQRRRRRRDRRSGRRRDARRAGPAGAEEGGEVTTPHRHLPLRPVTATCDRRSGARSRSAIASTARSAAAAAFAAQARFPVDQVTIAGESQRLDQGQRRCDAATDFHFCPTCGAPSSIAAAGFPDLDRGRHRRLRRPAPSRRRNLRCGNSASIVWVEIVGDAVEH